MIFLKIVSESISSPYAVTACVILVATWAYVSSAQIRIKKVTRAIRHIPEEQRKEILLQEYKTVPSDGISAAQWLRSRRQMMFFFAYVATLASLLTVLLFFLNIDSTTPNQNISKISQLAPPIKQIPIVEPYDGDNSGLKVIKILEGASKDEASRIFDIYLSNNAAEKVILSKFYSTWRYYPGSLAISEGGAILEPLAEYIVELPIDVLDDSRHSKEDIIYPVVVMEPVEKEEPSLVTLRLQVHYSLKQKRHPSLDWNILFSMSLLDEKGESASIFSNQSWKAAS